MRILFIPTLGKGFGHIKRALLIISQIHLLNKNCKISIIVDNIVLPFIDTSKANPIVLPFRCSNLYQEANISNSVINNSQYQEIVSKLVSALKPELVVYDFVISEPIFQIVCEYGGKNVLILREQKQKYIEFLANSGLLDYFEKILIPHEYEHFNLDRYPLYHKKTVNVGIISDKNTLKHDKKSIRSKFNISEDDKWVIISCGGGGFYNESDLIFEHIDNLKRYFNENEKWKFSCFEGIYNKNSQFKRKYKTLKIHEFDINLPSYLNAADVIVSLLGYNSYHEALNSGRPSILIPANRVLDDQKKRFDAIKLPNHIILCDNIKDLKNHLVNLIGEFKQSYNLDSSIFSFNGAFNAAQELLKIDIYSPKTKSNDKDCVILSSKEVENVRETFSKYFTKGVTKFYFKKHYLSPKKLQNIVEFKNELGEINVKCSFNLYDRTISNITQISSRKTINHVNLRITWKCNSKCEFCYHWKQNVSQPHMPFLKVVDIANQAKSLGAESVVLNGGEPTLHPNFFEILQVFNDLNYSITINTNGSKLLIKDFTDRLIRFPNLTLMVTILSIEDINLRGVNDWSAKSIKAIKLLKQNNAPITIRTNIVLNNKNFRQLDAILQKLLDARVDQITINLIDSVLNIDCSHLFLSENKLKDLYFRIYPSLLLKASLRNIKIKINPFFLRSCFNYAIKGRVSPFNQVFDIYYNKNKYIKEIDNFKSGLYGKYFYSKVKFCHIPDQNIYIMANGDVYPCLKAIGSLSYIPFGNLYYRNLNAIINSKKWLQFNKFAGQHKLCEICNNAFISNLRYFTDNEYCH